MEDGNSSDKKKEEKPTRGALQQQENMIKIYCQAQSPINLMRNFIRTLKGKRARGEIILDKFMYIK